MTINNYKKQCELVLTTSLQNDATTTLSLVNLKSGVCEKLWKSAGTRATGTNDTRATGRLLKKRLTIAESMTNNTLIYVAEEGKPLISTFSTGKQSPVAKSIVQEEMSAITASHSGAYLAAAGLASGKIYIWSLLETASSTSNQHLLLRVWDAHYMPINDLAWSCCDSILVSASQDGLVHVWSMSDILLHHNQENIKPKSSLHGHSLPVTSIHLSTLLANHARIFTTSLDATLKIWDPNTVSNTTTTTTQTPPPSHLLSTIIYPQPLTACVIDTRQATAYTSSTTGQIHKTNLYAHSNPSPSATTNKSAGASATVTWTSSGHRANTATNSSITCLALNMDETLLISGGGDCSCLVWDTETGSVLRALKNTSSSSGGFVYCFNLDFEGVGASGGGYGVERKKESQDGGLARFMSKDHEEEAGIVYTPALLDGARDGGGDVFRRVMQRLEFPEDDDEDKQATATATTTAALKSKDQVQKGQIERLLRLSSTMYQSLLAATK